MKTQYIIQITDHQTYPFDGTKQGCNVVVRTSLCTTPQTYTLTYSKVHALLNIKSPTIMQIIRIVQIKTKKFQIDYQYVSQSLKNSPNMNEPSFVTIFREFLFQHCKALIHNRIKQQIKLENIGITKAGQLKVYLGANFQLISLSQSSNLQEEYQIMVEKLIDSSFNQREHLKTPSDHTFVSDYSHRVSKKLSQLQDRLNKVRKYSKNSSLSSNQSNGKNQQLSSNNILKDLFAPKKSSKNEVATGLTSNSFILNKNGVRTKTHKLSFGDYETTSYRLDESTSKQSSLTKRINTALEKTQFAFKTYEKYSRKKNRKRS